MSYEQMDSSTTLSANKRPNTRNLTGMRKQNFYEDNNNPGNPVLQAHGKFEIINDLAHANSRSKLKKYKTSKDQNRSVHESHEPIFSRIKASKPNSKSRIKNYRRQINYYQ